MRTDGRGELHNKSRSSEYRIWAGMLNRCYNPNVRNYPRYGGRGIEVCSRWRHSFATFFADMGSRPKGLSLERKNNGGSYEPGNCMWASSSAQARNRRSSRLVEITGIVKTLAEWCELHKLGHATLIRRIHAKWPDDIILSENVPRSELRRRGIVAQPRTVHA